MASALTDNDQWRHSVIMTRAMDPEVFDTIWTAIEPILPKPDRSHPLGCHNPRVPDKVCFRGLMIRLVTGASWVDVEALLDHQVSDTTLRGRRDEWIEAGVFDRLCEEALAAFDRILELELDDVAIDGSLHKAPCGGEGTGPNPTDRGKLGHKWSLAVDGHGIPIGWTLDGANRNDIPMLEPTIEAIAQRGLLCDIGTLHLDRGYDYPKIRNLLHGLGLVELDIQKRGTKPPPGTPHRLTLGLRWIVEAANSWLSNYGQLRRSTDRSTRHRHAALCLATIILITARLIDYRNRWSPNP
ncbi:MAG: IS5 family transposase [Actinomycetia bacterium]|nr:IS5 family transposase [Actinomycetes bacterium]